MYVYSIGVKISTLAYDCKVAHLEGMNDFNQIWHEAFSLTVTTML